MHQLESGDRRQGSEDEDNRGEAPSRPAKAGEAREGPDEYEEENSVEWTEHAHSGFAVAEGSPQKDDQEKAVHERDHPQEVQRPGPYLVAQETASAHSAHHSQRSPAALPGRPDARWRPLVRKPA